MDKLVRHSSAQPRAKESAVVPKMADDNRVYADPPPCVDTGDQNSVKQALDEALMAAIQDCGHEEDMRQQNAKLVLMLLASIVASIAQFYEKYDKAWEFPVNIVLLFICTSLYFTASGVLQYVLTYKEKDCIAFYQPLNPSVHAGMAVHTTCGRFTDQYEITLVTRDGTGECLSKHYSVGEFFDIDGNLDEEAFDGKAKELVQRYDAKERDAKKATFAIQADFFPSKPKAKAS